MKVCNICQFYPNFRRCQCACFIKIQTCWLNCTWIVIKDDFNHENARFGSVFSHQILWKSSFQSSYILRTKIKEFIYVIHIKRLYDDMRIYECKCGDMMRTITNVRSLGFSLKTWTSIQMMNEIRQLLRRTVNHYLLRVRISLSGERMLCCTQPRQHRYAVINIHAINFIFLSIRFWIVCHSAQNGYSYFNGSACVSLPLLLSMCVRVCVLVSQWVLLFRADKAHAQTYPRAATIHANFN